MGAPKPTVAGALPLFTKEMPIGPEGVPTSVEGKAAEVGDDGAKVKVAPVGLTVSGRATLVCAGSFVKRLREPVRAVPAVDDP